MAKCLIKIPISLVLNFTADYDNMPWEPEMFADEKTKKLVEFLQSRTAEQFAEALQDSLGTIKLSKDAIVDVFDLDEDKNKI